MQSILSPFQILKGNTSCTNSHSEDGVHLYTGDTCVKADLYPCNIPWLVNKKSIFYLIYSFPTRHKHLNH